MNKTIQVLGISGSLRTAFTNTGSLRCAHATLPNGMARKFKPPLLYKPEVFIDSFAGSFDDQGDINDKKLKTKSAVLMIALSHWVNRLLYGYRKHKDIDLSIPIRVEDLTGFLGGCWDAAVGLKVDRTIVNGGKLW